MSVVTFGVTAAGVRADCFPHLPTFTDSTAPTSTQVATKINEQAGMLAGALTIAGVNVDSIEAASAGYYSCAGVLKLMVGVSLARSASGLNPAVVQAWRDEVKAWLDGLKANGGEFLGVPASAGTSPTGPLTFIDHLGLDVPSSADASSLEPTFRIKDLL